MSTDIFGIAYAMKAASAAAPTTSQPIKLSYTQQLCAAALGYGSLAAYQADDHEATDLAAAVHVVLDMDAVVDRAAELKLPHGKTELVSLMRSAFEERLPESSVHDSFDKLETCLLDNLQTLALNDERTSGAMASTNNDGIGEIYLPLIVPWDEVCASDGVVEVKIDGHINMELDNERPYSGHHIDVTAVLEISCIGRALFDRANFRLKHIALDYNWDGAGDEEMEVSLNAALSKLLGLPIWEHEDLDDAPVQTMDNPDGTIAGYLFDFTSLVSEEATEQIINMHGSLRVRAPADFFESVIDYRGSPRRYYVHGDEVEESPGMYFCRQCEANVEPAHFESAHPDETELRYVDGVERWKRWPARTKMNWRRPSLAKNCLAGVVEAAQAHREATRSAFHRWASEQESRDDRIGDLARDIRRDRKFPTAETSRDSLRGYIRRTARGWGVSEVFDEAWKEFRAARRHGG